MPFRALIPLLALTLSFVIAACSGGGGAANLVQQDCGNGGENLFCLVSCNLGCSQAGCSINRISQNEPVTLFFSQAVDPFSVPPHSTSILLRTASGQEPVGDWVVQDNRVTFVPTVLISGGSTFFGFRPSETYTLHLPSGPNEPDVVRSMSGDRLSSSITCPLTIGGIKDLNQTCPRATLATPIQTNGAPLDTRIVIEFNEIIDPAIFVDITSETSPIQYAVKSTQRSNGVSICRPTSDPTILPGVPRMSIDSSRAISVVTFTPQEPLPSNKCVEIQVTSKVRDLAGVPACAHVMSFTTQDVGPQVRSNVEDFATSKFLDRELSAGSWGNGKLTFSPLGGSGIHGPFDPSIGKDLTPVTSNTKIYQWSTDSQLIPKHLTATGQDITVTDGRFFFSSFDLPDGVEVHFVGSNPAQIWVRGSVQIGGLLASNGQSFADDDAAITPGNGPQSGEPGGKGGCFAGDGGAGGDRGNGNGTPNVAFNGKDGEDVVLKAGHAYTGRNVGTGGKGSPQHPADNDASKLTWAYFNVIAVEMNKGGSGGGFRGAGGDGKILWLAPNTAYQQHAATGITQGGINFDFPPTFPSSYPPSFTRADHFLVGGSGGGGGGSAPAGAIKTNTSTAYWKIGRGGGGGGGALRLRVGGGLKLLTSGRLTCEGGTAAQDTAFFSTRGMMTPGGGGSGGSLYVQVSRETNNLGLISVKGGGAGFTHGNSGDTIFAGCRSDGGAGGDGILHFEVVDDPSNYAVGNTFPATPPISRLAQDDLDDDVAIRSLWYAASLLFPPDFVRYEIEATIDGNRALFSDNANHTDPDFVGLAHGPNSPLKFVVQGAKLEVDPTGRLAPKPNTALFPFRKYVGIPPANVNEPSLFDDGATGYRFELALDRRLGKKVEVKKITVVWQL